jgi:hypothetical protein
MPATDENLTDYSVAAWAFSMHVAGTTYAAIAAFLLGIGVIPFSSTAVYSAQIFLVPAIIAFARKVCVQNREAMKANATIGIDEN